MATVHPSRLGLVPQSRAPSASPAVSTRHSTPASREDELRRQLLDRRKGKGVERAEISIKGSAESSRLASEGARDSSLESQDKQASERQGSEDPIGGERRSRGESGDRSVSRSAENSDAERPVRDDSGGGNGDRRDRTERDDRDARPRSRERRDDRYDGRHSRPRSRERRRERDEGYNSRPRSRERRDEREAVGYGDRSRRASPSYRPQHSGQPSREGSGPPRPQWMGNGPMPPFPPQNGVPPFPPQNGMPPFPPRAGMPPFPPRNGWNGPMDLEQRRLARENMTLSIWPASPERPYVDDEELEEERRAKRKARKAKSSKKSKRRSKYSDSDSSSTDSEEERYRRRKRKEKRRRYSSASDDSGDERRRDKRSRDRGTSADPVVEADKGDQWVEKDDLPVVRRAIEGIELPIPEPESDEDEVGPHLPTEHSGRDRFRTTYKDMLKGEAEAMALFAAEGKRIPRRGEIGLDSEQIEAFEGSGYVMSGSRHRRMNAVRLRKENQVINAEEKRAILKLQREEKEKKEGAIVSQFREMLEERLKASGPSQQ